MTNVLNVYFPFNNRITFLIYINVLRFLFDYETVSVCGGYNAFMFFRPSVHLSDQMDGRTEEHESIISPKLEYL